MAERQELEDYWREKAAKVGEPILFRSIAQHDPGLERERIGLLYLTAGALYFEHVWSEGSAFLDLLLSRRKAEAKTEVIGIPRAELRRACILNARMARQWLRQKIPVSRILSILPGLRPHPVLDFLAGKSIGVFTEDRLYLFRTPVDREWARRLGGETGESPRQDHGPPVNP
jgi:hypothetical protein